LLRRKPFVKQFCAIETADDYEHYVVFTKQENCPAVPLGSLDEHLMGLSRTLRVLTHSTRRLSHLSLADLDALEMHEPEEFRIWVCCGYRGAYVGFFYSNSFGLIFASSPCLIGALASTQVRPPLMPDQNQTCLPFENWCVSGFDFWSKIYL